MRKRGLAFYGAPHIPKGYGFLSKPRSFLPERIFSALFRQRTGRFPAGNFHGLLKLLRANLAGMRRHHALARRAADAPQFRRSIPGNITDHILAAGWDQDFPAGSEKG